MPELPIIARGRMHADRIAFHSNAGTQTYGQVVAWSTAIAATLLEGNDDLRQTRVVLVVSPGCAYTAAQWAVWRAGGIVVPICLAATAREWDYVLRDSQARIVIADSTHAARIEPLCHGLGLRLVVPPACPVGSPATAFPDVGVERPAMILYTSGTTSTPKGVVTTHATIRAQIESLVEAWEWTADDRIPLFLPLHHIHGIINIAGCGLWTGATVEPFQRFDMPAVLERVCGDAYTLFMAVPTIYVKLIEAIEAATTTDREAIVAGFRRMRLMVSGSAALPETVHARWTELTGQRLLERYGMTEIGMALSTSYRGERRAGCVGTPLPGVEVRLKTEHGAVINTEHEPGEIQVRGPGVFTTYWNRDEETAAAFENGWFRTGDVAVVERGSYRILGRLSIDIIKSGGYKLSALEIESALLEHPRIRECAVVGLPDDTWGEAVAAVCVLTDDAPLELSMLRDWCRGRLSPYKIPQRLLVVANLPRNAMAKTLKSAVKALFAAAGGAR
ncbi:MAG: acyl-CoA synthetase [Planctomycetaceae bacterium]